ncbi:MAG: preprotein translocase subunit SecG [Clostridiales bacterium]|nr:preprotein translocase subunit SecG [Clostridiales bacterium]
MILLSLVITILQLISCVALIGVVMLQSGKTAGLSGVIGGGSDTYLAKNKAKSLDAKMSRATKWVAIAFAVLTLLLSIIQ